MPGSRSERSKKSSAHAAHLAALGTTRPIVANRNAGPSQDQQAGSAAARRLAEGASKKPAKGRRPRFVG